MQPHGTNATPPQMTAVEVRREAGPTGLEAALQAGQTVKHVSPIAWRISYIMKWLILPPNSNLTVLKFPCALPSVAIPSLWVMNPALLLGSCLDSS